MKKLLTTGVAMLAMTFASAAFANDDMHGAGDSHHPYMEKMLAPLPPQKAAAFKQALQQAYDQNKPLHDQEKQLHEELHAIMVAPQFDSQAFVAKKAQIQQLSDQMRANMSQAFASGLAALSQGDRQKLADAMKARGEHSRAHHHDHGDSGKSGATPTDAQ